jgi:acyl-CoA synthetase (AMP-forming)/AMP-acid ligase II
MNVAELIRRQVAGRAHAPALTCPEGTITWSAMVARSAALSHSMRRAGIRAGDRVAILGTACHRYWETHLACAIGGYIAVPVNHRLSESEVAQILADAGCRLVVGGGDYAGLAVRLTLPELINVLGWGMGHGAPADFEAWVEQGDQAWAAAYVAPTDVNVLGYTSGTTGRPKAAAISHHTATTAALCFAAHWGMAPGATTMCCNAPYAYRGGPGFLAALAVGGHVVSMPFDAHVAARAIQEHGVSVMTMAPAMIELLLDAVQQAQVFSSPLQTLVVSGAPASPRLLRRIVDTLGDVVAVQYGMTEATGITMGRLSARVIREGGAALRAAGRPLPLVDLRMVDGSGQVCVPGEIGEIQVRGDGVMLGYWEDGGVTSSSFHEGWFPTGDIGRLDQHGLLYLSDRRADIINSGGYNVYSLEVENAIGTLPGVVSCAVVGSPHDRWGEQVTAVVVTDGSPVLADDIRDACRRLLASYKCPRKIDFVTDLPRNAMGKVDKRRVRSRYWETTRTIGG